jgi:2-polyprenyl-3-methyl-5-hydroxy-6-metoxy-1,4-benzoquinol methylase
MLDRTEVEAKLVSLNQEIPWTHHFDINGVHTTSPQRDDKFYRKSMGAKRLGELAIEYARVFSAAKSLTGLRVLDVASAEGGHSIEFARAGVSEVVGVEGRQLYVDRANFVAEALGVRNVRFARGDVRSIDPSEFGAFDISLCFGLLHHLGEPDFLPFLNQLGRLTKDVLILYTHVATPEAIQDFSLQGPRTVGENLTGYLLREHADDADQAEREAQVRASLDNTFSFWATEESLVRALKLSGFGFIAKIYEPHIFGGHVNRNLRVILVAKKRA